METKNLQPDKLIFYYVIVFINLQSNKIITIFFEIMKNHAIRPKFANSWKSWKPCPLGALRFKELKFPILIILRKFMMTLSKLRKINSKNNLILICGYTCGFTK